MTICICVSIQTTEVESLQHQLAEQAKIHSRELTKKEAEREIVFDDLESINDQYQQLNLAFETQARKLTKSQVRIDIYTLIYFFEF